MQCFMQPLYNIAHQCCDAAHQLLVVLVVAALMMISSCDVQISPPAKFVTPARVIASLHGSGGCCR